MAVMIKRGSGIPGLNDLQEHQLGFSTTDHHLYIKDSGTIVDLNNPYPITYSNTPFDITKIQNLGALYSGITSTNYANIKDTDVTTVKNSGTPYIELNIDNNIHVLLSIYKSGSANTTTRYIFYIKNSIDNDTIIVKNASFWANSDTGTAEGTLSDTKWHVLNHSYIFWWNRYKTIYDFIINSLNLRYLVIINHPDVGGTGETMNLSINPVYDFEIIKTNSNKIILPSNCENRI
jgi:hypothetical protein